MFNFAINVEFEEKDFAFSDPILVFVTSFATRLQVMNISPLEILVWSQTK